MNSHFRDLAHGRPKRERTRNLLIDGAIAVVAQAGVAKASVKAITEAVDLSNGTFYNHFADRDDLLREAALAIAEAMADDIAADVSDLDHGLARIARSTNAFMLHMLDVPEWAALWVGAFQRLGEIRHDFGRQLRLDLGRALEQGHLSHRPSRFTLHQIGVLIALAIEWQLARTRSRQVRRQTCEAVLRLLGLDTDTATETVAAAVPELSTEKSSN